MFTSYSKRRGTKIVEYGRTIRTILTEPSKVRGDAKSPLQPLPSPPPRDDDLQFGAPKCSKQHVEAAVRVSTATRVRSDKGKGRASETSRSSTRTEVHLYVEPESLKSYTALRFTYFLFYSQNSLIQSPLATLAFDNSQKKLQGQTSPLNFELKSFQSFLQNSPHENFYSKSLCPSD